jgi:hypothetical protein
MENIKKKNIDYLKLDKKARPLKISLLSYKNFPSL